MPGLEVDAWDCIYNEVAPGPKPGGGGIPAYDCDAGACACAAPAPGRNWAAAAGAPMLGRRISPSISAASCCGPSKKKKFKKNLALRKKQQKVITHLTSVTGVPEAAKIKKKTNYDQVEELQNIDVVKNCRRIKYKMKQTPIGRRLKIISAENWSIFVFKIPKKIMRL